MNKPFIGITLDWEDKMTYSSYSPWYALRENYIKAVINAGGTPILIPYDLTSIEEYANKIDGLIITGGDYDLDPSHYNEVKDSGTRNQKELRVEFELALLRKMIVLQKPILGICAGQQLIAVKIGGGSLIQDISSDYNTTIEHEQSKNNIHHGKASHSIDVVQGTLFYKIVQTSKMYVNSTHHQAVKSIGDEFVVCAYAPDGIIEAIEHKNYPFMLGVEWHPEYEISEYDSKIFSALVKVALK